MYTHVWGWAQIPTCYHGKSHLQWKLCLYISLSSSKQAEVLACHKTSRFLSFIISLSSQTSSLLLQSTKKHEVGEEKPQGLSCATSSKSKETTPWVIRRFSGWWQGDPSVDISVSFLSLSFQGDVKDVKWVLDIPRNTQLCKAWLVWVWVNPRQGKGGMKLPTWSFCHEPSLADSQPAVELSNIGSWQPREQMESTSLCADNTLLLKQDYPDINSVLSQHLKLKLKLTKHCFFVVAHHTSLGEFRSGSSLPLQETSLICWSQSRIISRNPRPKHHPREEP